MSRSSDRGYGFEYSTIIEGKRILKANIVSNTQIWIDEKGILKYNALPIMEKQAMIDASSAIVKFLTQYEPWLLHEGVNIDYVGTIRGSNDVSDVRFSTSTNSVGVSLKSNHDAVRHPRVSPTIDIAQQWLGVETDQQYMAEVGQIMQDFNRYCNTNDVLLYSQLSKNNLDLNLYKPITECFAAMLSRIFNNDNGRQQAISFFLRYLIGDRDFYKAKADFNRREIRIDAYDITGSLGTRGQLKMPTKCHEVLVERGRERMHNYISITFDQGWQLKMRLHNADKRIQNSLKWDVRFIGTPQNTWSTRLNF